MLFANTIYQFELYFLVWDKLLTFFDQFCNRRLCGGNRHHGYHMPTIVFAKQMLKMSLFVKDRVVRHIAFFQYSIFNRKCLIISIWVVLPWQGKWTNLFKSHLYSLEIHIFSIFSHALSFAFHWSPIIFRVLYVTKVIGHKQL